MRTLAIPIFLFVFCACAQSATSSPPHMKAAQRIVSLMPSLTEDLCAIGAQKQIVAVSQYSEDIPCARGLPSVGNAASIDAERIVRMHADAIAGIPEQRLMTQPLRRAGIATVFFKDASYEDIFSDIEGLGALSGHAREAHDLTESLKAQTAALQRSERLSGRPRVFVVIQAQPIWTVGPQSYIATLVSLAGGQNAVTRLPQPYAQYGAEALLRLQPDAIIATSDSGLRSVLGREPWRSLHAVAEKHVYVLQDDAILVRPGPRYNQGLSWLIERLKQPAT